jgi:DNA topoisomerase-2
MADEKYETMTQREHVLKKSGMYIGATQKEHSENWVLGPDKKMIKETLFYSKGLLKIYDEIISNTQDIWNKKTYKITEVNVDIEKDMIIAYNNGTFIPHKKMKDGQYTPSVMFGQLLTSSNYTEGKDTETIGTFGIGAKATNIFSKYFKLESYDGSKKILFTQEWKNNMADVSEPEITQGTSNVSFVRISFIPDLKRFGMTSLDADIIKMFKKRLLDLAATCPGLSVSFSFNKQKSNFKIDKIQNYVKLYSSSNFIFEEGDGYQFAVIFDIEDGGQISFVNGNFTKSGIHLSALMNLINKVIKDKYEKKIGASKKLLTTIKNRIFVFLSCSVKDPGYNSQTKEDLVSGILPKLVISDKAQKKIGSSSVIKELIDGIVEQENKTLDKKVNKKDNPKTISKLDDANFAGTKRAGECILILTEGDSAKTLAVTGLSELGRNLYGIFPLKGKLLNVRTATRKQIIENAEIKALISILGLDTSKKYTNVSSLRYGKILLMTDQDNDGSHIKGLIINFIEYYWPELLSLDFLYEFITPIVNVTSSKETIRFFNLFEFEQWYTSVKNPASYKIKYYKGLGTSSDKEIGEYFKNMKNHIKRFTYEKGDEVFINMAFDRKKVSERKKWIERILVKPELEKTDILYNTGDGPDVSFKDFINKELIHFSLADIKRSIPNIMDGFKPGQRKILHVLLKRAGNNEIKVEQLAGLISSTTAYHHGEQSLKMSIISMANNFIGSNNINFLEPIGQFGSRLQGGKDASSPRYIHTRLDEMTRYIFIKEDEHVLNYLNDENQMIEPDFFVPIIPTILVNGALGIGTGWATKIPSFNPLDIIEYYLSDKKKSPIHPWYRNFTGQMFMLSKGVYLLTGVIHIHSSRPSIVISELPIGTWTDNFKADILQDLNIDVEYHGTKTTPLFIINFKNPAMFNEIKEKPSGFYNYFKLHTKIRTKPLVAFKPDLSLHEYESPEEIMNDFEVVRLKTYQKRKDYLIEEFKRNIRIASNRYRFISSIIDDTINIYKKKEKDIIDILVKEKYDTVDDGFNYLLNMNIKSFTKEKLDELKNYLTKEKAVLEATEKKSIKDMWKDELLILKKKIGPDYTQRSVVKLKDYTLKPYVIDKEVAFVKERDYDAITDW